MRSAENLCKLQCSESESLALSDLRVRDFTRLPVCDCHLTFVATALLEGRYRLESLQYPSDQSSSNEICSSGKDSFPPSNKQNTNLIIFLIIKGNNNQNNTHNTSTNEKHAQNSRHQNITEHTVALIFMG